MLRAVVGLALLNLFFLGVGAGLLWGLRGWRWWTEFLSVAGLAYFLGLASMMIVLTSAVVVGIPFGALSLLTGGCAIAAAGLVLGLYRGHHVLGFRPAEWHVLRVPSISAAGIAVVAVYFIAFFQAARLHPAGEWDAWWVWTIRAKALYFFGDLGGADLVHGSDYPSYPPGLSLVHAAGFVAMGGVDTVTLHIQHWFFALGFALALAGLLAHRVRSLILVPLLILALVMPGFRSLVTFLYADLLLAFFLALAAVLLMSWLEDRENWQLAATAVLLAGALVTKRDGILFVACLLAACFVATFSQRGWAWSRLGGTALASAAMALPWWIGRTTGSRGAEPSAGLLGFLDHSSRVLPSLKLVGTAFVDPDLWLGMTWLVSVGVLLAVASRLWTYVVFSVMFTALSSIGLAVVLSSEPRFALTRDPFENPVDRLTMVTVIVLAAVTPMLLEHALRRDVRRSLAREAPSQRG